MEDIKWFIKKFGIIFVILLVMIVSVGIFFEKNVRKSSAEETWEKPVQISDIEFWQEESDYERENEDNSPYWIIPQSKSLLSEEESKNIQNEALTAAELVKVVYKDIVIIDDVPAYASGIDGFTNEQGEQVIKILGKSGYVCVKENIEMQNYDKLQNFYIFFNAYISTFSKYFYNLFSLFICKTINSRSIGRYIIYNYNILIYHLHQFCRS